MRIRAAGLVIKNSKLLIIHRFRDGEEYWVLPGGGVDEGETPQEAVIREIKEETSIEAQLKSNELIFKDQYAVQGETSEHQIFVLEYISGEPQLSKDSIEVSKTTEQNTYEPMWVDLKDIESLNIKPPATKEFLMSYINK